MMERLHDEKREDHKEMWDAIKETSQNVSDLASSVSGLTGKFMGYLAAGSLVIGVITFVAAKVFK